MSTRGHQGSHECSLSPDSGTQTTETHFVLHRRPTTKGHISLNVLHILQSGEMECYLFSYIKTVTNTQNKHVSCTFICHQSLGSAAMEAVQQRLGSDVVVEKRHGAADLQQPQPQKQEDGLISQEQRHLVALFNAAALQEDSGRLAAEFVGVPVGVVLIFEADEQLVRLRLDHLKEAVQGEIIPFISLLDLAPHFQLVAHVSDILNKVRMAGKKHKEKQQSRHHDPDQHVFVWGTQHGNVNDSAGPLKGGWCSLVTQSLLNILICIKPPTYLRPPRSCHITFNSKLPL